MRRCADQRDSNRIFVTVFERVEVLLQSLIIMFHDETRRSKKILASSSRDLPWDERARQLQFQINLLSEALKTSPTAFTTHLFIGRINNAKAIWNIKNVWKNLNQVNNESCVHQIRFILFIIFSSVFVNKFVKFMLKSDSSLI